MLSSENRQQRKYKNDYSNQDFTTLSKEQVRKFDFRNSNLQGANFEGCQYLYGKNFSRANMSGANLRKANVSSASFKGANLYGVNFENANIYGTNFENANLKEANFSFVKTNYPLLWSIFIKALVVLLSVLSALVLFYSIDIFQVLANPPEGLKLSDAISDLTGAVLLEGGDSTSSTSSISWSNEIIEAAELVKQRFEPIFEKSVEVSEEIISISNNNEEWYLENIEAHNAASYFLELKEPASFNTIPSFLFLVFIVISLLLIVFVSVSPDFFGIVIVFIAIAIAFAAPIDSLVAVPIVYGLISLLGIISGLLVRAVSSATLKAADFSDSENKFVTFFSWIGSILGILCLSVFTIPGDAEYLIWVPLSLSVILLWVGEFILGKKRLLGEHKIIVNSNGDEVSVESQRYLILEFFAVRLLRMTPATNFWSAELKGAKFMGANLKEYLTSIGGRDYDDETLEAILRQGEGEVSRRFYEKLLRLSGDSSLYSGLIVNVMRNRMQEIWFLGNVNNEGIMNFGEIVGDAINRLSNSPLQKEDMNFRIDESLITLLHKICSAEEMSNEDKFKALKQLEKFAKTLQIKK